MTYFSELGYDSYNGYLNSKHWDRLKDVYWKSTLPKYCRICDAKTNLIMHHRTYERLGKEDLRRDLVVLCNNCHRDVHFDAILGKTPLVYEELLGREKLLRKQWLLENLKATTFFPIMRQLIRRFFR